MAPPRTLEGKARQEGHEGQCDSTEYTRVWAAELGKDGTTDNCVNPGPVQSEMLEQVPKEIVEPQLKATPVQQRSGKPEEIAEIVAWLASEGASWVSGQAISASGGFAMY